MKKNTLDSLRIVITSLFALPALLSAQTNWTGSVDDDFNNAGNWDDGLPGNPTPTPVISLDGADVVTTANRTTRSTLVSGNGSTAPKLTIRHDYTNPFSAFQVGSDSSGSNYSGVVEVTAGSLNIINNASSSRLEIAAAASSSTSGNQGTFILGGTSSDNPSVTVDANIRIGNRPGEAGTLTLQDYGSISSIANVQMGELNGTAIMNVTGGNLSINFATGVSAGSPGLSFARSGGGNSTLNASIDSTGFSTINVGGDVRLGNSISDNDASFNLSLGGGFTPTAGSKYTIISATGAFTGGETFNNVGDGDILSVGGFDFEADYTGGEFSVTAIPEPGSIALWLGAASLLSVTLLRRRR